MPFVFQIKVQAVKENYLTCSLLHSNYNCLAINVEEMQKSIPLQHSGPPSDIFSLLFFRRKKNQFDLTGWKIFPKQS